MSTFSRILKTRFENSEFTQPDLAALIGVSLPTMQAYLEGRQTPTLYYGIKLAKIFGINLMRLPSNLDGDLENEISPTTTTEGE